MLEKREKQRNKKIAKSQIRWVDLGNIERVNNIQFTKGQKHLWYYFEEIVRTEDFQNFIRKMRRKYKIPKSGYDINDRKFGFEGIACAPPEKSYLGNKRNTIRFYKETKEKCNQLGLSNEWWKIEIGQLILWNLTLGPLADNKNPHQYPTLDLCQLAENPNKQERIFYPVVFKINPYASRNEIIDFVKKTHRQVKEIQKKFIKTGLRIKKIRKKKPNLQARNDFIYALYKKGLSLKQISEEVSKKSSMFSSDPDIGEIGKIISLERNKRK